MQSLPYHLYHQTRTFSKVAVSYPAMSLPCCWRTMCTFGALLLVISTLAKIVSLSLSLSLDSGLSLFLSDTLPNTFQHNSACKLRADVSQTTEGRQQRTSHPQVPSITRPHHRGSRTWDDPSLCSLTRFTPVPSDMFYNLGPSYIVTNRGSICRFTC